MKKMYFKVNFTYVKDGAKLESYGFVSAYSAETAKQLALSELSSTHRNVEVIKCIQVSKEYYKSAMLS